MKHTVELLISIDDVEEANLFLRAVWSRIRSEFGKCAWHFAPRVNRNYQTIHFGSFVTDDESLGQTRVYVSYRKKGGIHKLAFHNEHHDLSRLQQLLKNLKHDYKNNYSYTWVRAVVNSGYPISPYQSEKLRIEPMEQGHSALVFNVGGFDSPDRLFNSKKVLNTILDIIAGNIWTSIKRSSVSNEVPILDIPVNVFSEAVDYAYDDDRCVHQGFIYLPQKAITLIELLLSGVDLPVPVTRLFSAFRLYHSSLKLERLDSIEEDIDIYEITMTKYMSTLEVLSINDNKVEKCASCKQDIYSISSRVKTLLSKVFHEEAIVKRLHEYYTIRSKFLHTGKYYSTRSYLGTSIPQLTANDDLVEYQYMYDTGTLKYAVGQCLDYYQHSL